MHLTYHTAFVDQAIGELIIAAGPEGTTNDPVHNPPTPQPNGLYPGMHLLRVPYFFSCMCGLSTQELRLLSTVQNLSVERKFHHHRRSGAGAHARITEAQTSKKIGSAKIIGSISKQLQCFFEHDHFFYYLTSSLYSPAVYANTPSLTLRSRNFLRSACDSLNPPSINIPSI